MPTSTPSPQSNESDSLDIPLFQDPALATTIDLLWEHGTDHVDFSPSTCNSLAPSLDSFPDTFQSGMQPLDPDMSANSSPLSSECNVMGNCGHWNNGLEATFPSALSPSLTPLPNCYQECLTNLMTPSSQHSFFDTTLQPANDVSTVQHSSIAQDTGVKTPLLPTDNLGWDRTICAPQQGSHPEAKTLLTELHRVVCLAQTLSLRLEEYQRNAAPSITMFNNQGGSSEESISTSMLFGLEADLKRHLHAVSDGITTVLQQSVSFCEWNGEIIPFP